MLLGKRIGVDIDGTLTTMEVIVDVFNRETGKELRIEDIVEYDVGKCYGISKEEANSIWGNYTGEIVEKSRVIGNLEEFMGKWEFYGGRESEIVIVTARPIEYRDITEEWLRRYGIEYSELYLGYSRKLEAVLRYNLSVFVDDRAETIKEIDKFGRGCKGYLVDQPYNRWYQTERRIYTKTKDVVTVGRS